MKPMGGWRWPCASARTLRQPFITITSVRRSATVRPTTPCFPEMAPTMPLPQFSTRRPRTDVAGLDIEADLGFATLTSSTSWYETQEKALESDGGVYQLFLADQYYFGYPRFVVPGRTVLREHAATQELRLASTGTHTFDWLVGSYFQQQNRRYSLVDAGDPGLADYVAALNPFEAYFGTPTPSISG